MCDSDDFQETLVEAIRKYPCLWDQRERAYRDKRKKEEAWLAVKKEVDVEKSLEEMKKTWKHLRDYYVKEKKKMERRSGDAAGASSSWGLFKVLDFLRETVRHRRTASNFTSSPNVTEKNTSLALAETESLADEDVDNCSDDGVVCDSDEDFNIDRDDFAAAEENVAIRRSISVPSNSLCDTPKKFAQADNKGNQTRKRKRKSAHDIKLELLQVVKSLSASEQKKPESPSLQDSAPSAESAFGQMVAATSQRLNPRAKALAQLQIQEVLFKAEFPDPLLASQPN